MSQFLDSLEEKSFCLGYALTKVDRFFKGKTFLTCQSFIFHMHWKYWQHSRVPELSAWNCQAKMAFVCHVKRFQSEKIRVKKMTPKEFLTVSICFLNVPQDIDPLKKKKTSCGHDAKNWEKFKHVSLDDHQSLNFVMIDSDQFFRDEFFMRYLFFSSFFSRNMHKIQNTVGAKFQNCNTIWIY